MTDDFDRNILLKLKSVPAALELWTRSHPHEQQSLELLFSLDRDLIDRIRKWSDSLRLFNMLTDEQGKSLLSLLSNHANLAKILRTDERHITNLYHIWPWVDDRSQFIKRYVCMAMSRDFDPEPMMDAFSLGQISSKIWLIQKLQDLDLCLRRTWVLCGWIGVLSYLLLCKQRELDIVQVRSFDIDPACCVLADTLNKDAVIDNWRFKASTLDVQHLNYDEYAYLTRKTDGGQQWLIESCDTIINTSTDHLSDNSWFDRIPAGKLVVIQNNDNTTLTEHTNTVSSLDELVARYPMTTLLYGGTLPCDHYNRYMIIGYK